MITGYGLIGVNLDTLEEKNKTNRSLILNLFSPQGLSLTSFVEVLTTFTYSVAHLHIGK